ncbi:unannotated protein [freshwater metagenome]|uniref:Unannotated protein n=1 Tax=freshwater metagenome TaxID=449393 RepID=A0A6J7IUG1_9ZZZZ|nr:hypothetical protein [Actinomycetota bacterium]
MHAQLEVLDRESPAPVRAFLARPPITPRQREVVALVIEGCTNVEIAGHLQISHRTVQSHVAAAMRQLEARTRTQLAVAALRSGLVPLHPVAGVSPPA